MRQAAAKGPKANIFAKRSALILHDLLLQPENEFSLQALARNTGISVGLAHRVISELVHDGFVRTEGVRTAKKYSLVKRGALLELWLAAYSITDKNRFYTYNTACSQSEIKEKLRSSRSSSSVILALHSACRQSGFSFTNLETTDFYLRNPKRRGSLERLLKLEPQDRGYQVLIIEPYYLQIAEERSEKINGLLVSSPLHTVLDLYHFPLRGQEQAEYLLRKHRVLKMLWWTLKKN